jgi:predicted GIY-YIG superfamily endonuclease
MYNENMSSYFVYMLRCSDGTFYIGSTSNLSKRITEHETGALSNSYTYSRRPVNLVWSQEFPTHEEAFAFERQIKGWSRAKKKALIRDDWEEIHRIVRDERRRREREKGNPSPES